MPRGGRLGGRHERTRRTSSVKGCRLSHQSTRTLPDCRSDFSTRFRLSSSSLLVLVLLVPVEVCAPSGRAKVTRRAVDGSALPLPAYHNTRQKERTFGSLCYSCRLIAGRTPLSSLEEGVELSLLVELVPLRLSVCQNLLSFQLRQPHDPARAKMVPVWLEQRASERMLYDGRTCSDPSRPCRCPQEDTDSPSTSRARCRLRSRGPWARPRPNHPSWVKQVKVKALVSTTTDKTDVQRARARAHCFRRFDGLDDDLEERFFDGPSSTRARSSSERSSSDMAEGKCEVEVVMLVRERRETRRQLH